MDKSKYYVINYEQEEEEEEEGSSYTFQYVISFLIPLIGYILGAILLSKEDAEQRSVGKKCIILGICATLLGGVLYVLAALIFPLWLF
ncbi:MAG: hypothetical protein IKE65_04080 [Clostridia bacterium]|nr:hypothetical protein [Clostridia bacterium]